MAALGFLRAPTIYFNHITQIPVVNNLTHPPPLSSQSKITIKKEVRCFFSLGRRVGCFPLACLPPHPSPHFASRPKTRLFVSGLSFRTTEHGLRNAFQGFGQLVEVNLVMDKIANRPRGFAFLRYETEEESQRAIEGMHGKSCRYIACRCQVQLHIKSSHEYRPMDEAVHYSTSLFNQSIQPKMPNHC